VRADGSERHGKNPRLKLMRCYPSVSLHHVMFPLSSSFHIRMKIWILVRCACVHCHSVAHKELTGQVKVSGDERQECGCL
jgi:hypothetical protein